MKKQNLPLIVASTFTALFASAPLLAQDDQASDQEAAAGVLEEVVITGSRIRQNPLETRTPVQFINEDDMDLTGTLSIGDYLQRLPIAGSAINRLNNSSGNLGFPSDGGGIGAGASEIDLRYLTSKRTLVLVDGRRWIRGSSGSGVSGAVDLNTIPANAIKSIEILQDGASAIYGSDAIGGVVNIITQDNYQGFRATTQYGQFDEGDGESVEVDVRWGAESDRSRTFVDVSFTDQKNVGAGDRAISEYPLFGRTHGASSGIPDGHFFFTHPGIDTDPQGRGVGVLRLATNPGVGTRGTPAVFDPDCPNCDDFHFFGLDDFFNYQPFNFLLTPNKRTSIFAKSEYDITESTMLRVLASFNNRESTSRAAPEPLFFGPDGGAGAWMESAVWPADHPYNPFGETLGPDEILWLSRRPIEAGPRVFDQSVDTWYVSAGLDGKFETGGSPIYWDATVIFSENQASQIKHGAFNARNLVNALGPPEVCALIPNCTPFNFVGLGSITQEMLDYVTFVQKDVSQQEMTDFSFNLTGEFGGFAAGPIGWAVGFEHREEDGFFTPDSVVSSGETAGIPANPTAGGFEVDELYAELLVPIFEGDNGAKIDISAAVRSSDYDLFSSETVADFGFNWAPNEDLLFRASFSEGFRAPNIGELFNTGSRFDASIVDPCSSPAPEDAANCLALGVPADYVSANPQIGVTTGGNPNLTPETADTFTAGFVWDVGAADNWDSVDALTFELNYYDIEIDNAIQAPDPQGILNRCTDTLDPFFCDAINRTASGAITRVEGLLQNIGGIETSGFDWNLNLTFAETDAGRFRLQWLNTYLSDYTEIIPGPEDFIRVSREGTEQGSPERAWIEYKTTLNLDWFRGNWSTRLAVRYYDSIDEPCGGLAGDFEAFDLCTRGADGNTIGSVTFVDAQVNWRASFDDRWSFQLGVDNLFEEDPPFCTTCDLNSFDGTIYPIPGVFWYTRATFEID